MNRNSIFRHLGLERRSSRAGLLFPANLFSVGALVGFGAGWLLAPRSGAETRQTVRRTARDALDGLGKLAIRVGTELGNAAVAIGPSEGVATQRALEANTGRDLDELSRAELYALARHVDLEGRSGMNKDELRRALRAAGA